MTDALDLDQLADAPTPETVAFDCPRCGSAVVEAYYAPCETCRAAMRAATADMARPDLEAEAYTPKMNVTPNAVALKDD